MFHKKTDTLAKVMRENHRPTPRNQGDKKWKEWPDAIEALLAYLLLERGYESIKEKLREIKNKDKIQITKIKFPTQK